MYVDHEFYEKAYRGTSLTEESFTGDMFQAEQYIRYLTYLNGDIFADEAQAEAVKGAVCAAADAYHAARMEQEQGGNLRSESKDGLSVSFIVSRKDGETTEDYAKRCMYQAVRPILLPTGWLSRRGKVGCVHAHEHKSGDCL